MKKSKRNGSLAAIVLSVTALSMMSGCNSSTEEVVEKKNVVVETAVPVRGELSVSGNFMGTVTPEEEVYVMALVNGEVTDCNVSVGDYVSEGMVLGKIDDKAAKLQVQSANASLATVVANKSAATGGANTLQNMQTEANINTIKDNMTALEDNKTTVEDAQKELEEQMDKLKDTKKEAKDAYSEAKQNTEYAKTLAEDPSNKEAKKALKKAGYEINKTNPIEVVLATCQAVQTATKEAYTQVKTAYDTNYPVLEKQYEEIKSSIKELDRNYDTLQDNLKLAEDSYALSKGQIAKEQAAIYDAQINSAKVGVESANYQKDMYTLTAPIDGVVEAVNIEENGFVSSGSPAFIISNKDSMKATFKVSEEIQKTLTVGDAVIAERNGVYYEGKITQVGRMVDQQSGLFLVEAAVYAKDDALLTGTSVKLTVTTYKEKDTLMIPYDAIFYDNTLAYVYVAKDGKAVKTQIEVSLFNDTHAAVKTGLTQDDKVITTYSSALSDGAALEIKETGKERQE